MSIHPSLRSKGSLGALRNVLKRHERVRHMMAQGTWVDGQAALGLPKIKQVRLKSRKAAKEKGDAAAGETPAAPAAGAPS